MQRWGLLLALALALALPGPTRGHVVRAVLLPGRLTAGSADHGDRGVARLQQRGRRQRRPKIVETEEPLEEIKRQLADEVKKEVKEEVAEEVKEEVLRDKEVQESLRRLVREEEDAYEPRPGEKLSKAAQKLLDDDRNDFKAAVWVVALVGGLGLLTMALVLLALQWDEKATRQEALQPKEDASAFLSLAQFVLRRRNVLLSFTPVALGVRCFLGHQTMLLFLTGFLMILGLALLVESIFEDLSLLHSSRFMPLVIAGVTSWLELAMVLQSLLYGNIALTKGSLIGFILHNVLFSTGLLFVVSSRLGTATPSGDEVNRVTAHLQLLLLFALILIAVNEFVTTTHMTSEHELSLSNLMSVMMLVIFGALLLFVIAAKEERHVLGSPTYSRFITPREPMLTIQSALVLLMFCAIGVYFASGFMVRSMDIFSRNSGLSHTFVSVVLVPFTTGSAELVVTLVLVQRGVQQLSFATELLLTSATLTSFVVIPVTVLIAAFLPGEAISLNFKSLYSDAIGGSILFVYVLCVGENWDWWRGVLLMALYVIFGLLFFFSPDEAVLSRADH